MAYLEIKNTRIAGISACVPKKTINNFETSARISEEYDNIEFVNTTGVIERHFDDSVTASDMFVPAANELIRCLNWEKETIGVLIVVTQTPDYAVPATACVLQDKLGLSKECMAFDISLGCSGWIYGLSVISSIIQSRGIKRGLLLVGDGRWPQPFDNPLFGLAGTATAIETGGDDMEFYLGTDGSGQKAIYAPGGGSKYRLGKELNLNDMNPQMNGMDVFSFGITTAPKAVKRLFQKFSIIPEEIDYYLFHQANKKMNETIVKKLKLPNDKVPVGLSHYGNTSGASIPLAIVTEIGESKMQEKLNLVCCAFGVGLSWGAVKLSTDHLCIPQLILI